MQKVIILCKRSGFYMFSVLFMVAGPLDIEINFIYHIIIVKIILFIMSRRSMSRNDRLALPKSSSPDVKASNSGSTPWFSAYLWTYLAIFRISPVQSSHMPTMTLLSLILIPLYYLIPILYAYLNNRSIFRVYDTACPLPADGGYCIIEL